MLSQVGGVGFRFHTLSLSRFCPFHTGSENQPLSIHLEPDIEWFPDEGGVYRSAKGNDDVAFTLRLARKPTEEEHETLSSMLTLWKNEQQQRIGDYGWFHRISRPLFDDDVVRWSIDTTSQGIQFDSLNALQAWLTKIPTLRVIDLTLSGIT